MLLVGWYFAVTFCYTSYYSVFVLHLISAPKFSATSSGIILYLSPILSF